MGLLGPAYIYIYIYKSVCDVTVYILCGAVYSEKLKILNAILCIRMATTNKLLREDEVFGLLKDSYVCLVTEAKQTPVMMRQRPHLSRCEWYSQNTEETKKDRRIHCLQRHVGLRFEVITQFFFYF